MQNTTEPQKSESATSGYLFQGDQCSEDIRACHIHKFEADTPQPSSIEACNSKKKSEYHQIHDVGKAMHVVNICKNVA